MSANQQLVVEALNEATLASNAKQRVQHLEQLHELLVKNEPALLDEYLAHLVPFQVDKAASVRRRLVELITAAVQARPSPAVVSAAAPCLTGLLADEQLSVAREAAQAARMLVQAGLIMLATTPQGEQESALAAWRSAKELQAALATNAASASVQVAMRMAGIKVTEQAVLMCTSHQAQQLPAAAAAALAAAADAAVQQLAQLLPPEGVKQQPGPVVVCAIRALGMLAQQRPQLLGSLLPPLLALANQAVFKAPALDDGQSGVQASCGSTLRDVLNRLLRSSGGGGGAKAWVQQLDEGLRAMGAGAMADAARKYLDKLAARARAEKRKAEQQLGGDAKAARSLTPQIAGDATPGRTPTPGPGDAATAAAAAAAAAGGFMAPFRPGAPVTPEVLNGAQQILEKLVEIQHNAAVEAFLSQVSPDILAELVVRWMSNLPAKPAPPAADAQPAAAAAKAASTAAAAAAAMQAQLSSLGRQQAATAAAAAAAQQPQQQVQQLQLQQPHDPRRRAGQPGGPPLPSPLPLPLQPAQLAALRAAAVRRILAATHHKPIRNFRELLLSRLVSRAPAADGLTELMLQHVLSDYHTNRGHLLLIRWLYALAAAVTAEAQAARQPGGGGDGAAAAAGAAADAMDADEVPAANGSAAAAAVDGGDVEAGTQQDGMDEEQQQQPTVEQEQQQPQQPEQARKRGSRIGQSSSSNWGSKDGGSEGSTAPDLSGTAYEQVLLSSLRGLVETLPGADPAIPRLLQDAPVLPLAAVTAFLQGLVDQGSDWALTGLNTAQALFEARPPARGQLLQLLLDAAVATDSFTRDRAVGLLVSKVMSWEGHAPAVVAFATQQLQRLLEWEAKLLQQQQAAAEAEQQKAQQPEQQQQQPDTRQEQPEQQPGRAAAAAAAGADAFEPGTPAAADHAAASDDADAAAEAVPPLDVDAAAQHCMLFMSLCTLRPELLQLLLETYGKGGRPVKEAMQRYAPSLAMALGPSNAALLAIIQAPPPGSLELLASMLLALTDKALPPKELAQACAAHYAASGSVALLLFVIAAMTKADAAGLLPKMVVELDRPRLRLLYRRLTSKVEGKQAPHFAAVELLVKLHQLQAGGGQGGAAAAAAPGASSGLTTAQVQGAVDVALHAPEVFNASTIMTALQRMEAMTPLPPLFMRSVITLMRVTPALLEPILELLKRLVPKQIWADKGQWKGFIIACRQAGHHAYPILLTLPPTAMEEALDAVGEAYSRDLIKRALGGQVPVPLYENMKEVLSNHMDKLLRSASAAVAAAGGRGGDTAGGSGSKPAPVARTGSGAKASSAKKPAAAAKRAPASAGGEQQQQQQQQPAPVVMGDEEEEDEFMLDFEDD